MPQTFYLSAVTQKGVKQIVVRSLILQHVNSYILSYDCKKDYLCYDTDNNAVLLTVCERETVYESNEAL